MRYSSLVRPVGPEHSPLQQKVSLAQLLTVARPKIEVTDSEPTSRPVSSEAVLPAGATVADGLCTGQKPAVTSACNTGSCVCPARQSICSTYACSANFCQSKGYLGGEYCAYTYYTPFWGATTVATNTIGSAQPNQCCANQVMLVDMLCAICDVTIMHGSNTEQHCTALIDVEAASVASVDQLHCQI